MNREIKLKHGDALILKKDWPPFPVGTEFKVRYGVASEIIIHTPTFGDILPNKKKIDSIAVRSFSQEYIRMFENFGGLPEWFTTKKEIEIESFDGNTIKFKGRELTEEDIEIIKSMLE